MGLGHCLQHAVPILERVAGPRRDRPLVDREVGVWDDELRVDLELDPQPVAGLARPVRRVEREVPGSELVERQPAERARERLREVLDLLAAVVRLDRDRRDAFGELERGLQRVGDAAPDVRLGDQAVDDDLDRVLVVLGRRIGSDSSRTSPSMRARGNPLRARSPRSFSYSPLRPRTIGRQHLELRALRQLHHLVDDLLGRLAADRAAAVRAVRVADPGEEHPEVVVDLGDGPDGRTGVPRGGLLVDRDGRREALDEVDVGLLHLPEELPGVRRQRLHVPSLALGVDRVEGQRGLPGAGQAREHDELVTGKVERDVLQVVLTGAVNDKPFGAHESSVVATRDTPSSGLSQGRSALPWSVSRASRPPKPGRRQWRPTPTQRRVGSSPGRGRR